MSRPNCTSFLNSSLVDNTRVSAQDWLSSKDNCTNVFATTCRGESGVSEQAHDDETHRAAVDIQCRVDELRVDKTPTTPGQTFHALCDMPKELPVLTNKSREETHWETCREGFSKGNDSKVIRELKKMENTGKGNEVTTSMHVTLTYPLSTKVQSERCEPSEANETSTAEDSETGRICGWDLESRSSVSKKIHALFPAHTGYSTAKWKQEAYLGEVVTVVEGDVSFDRGESTTKVQVYAAPKAVRRLECKALMESGCRPNFVQNRGG